MTDRDGRASRPARRLTLVGPAVGETVMDACRAIGMRASYSMALRFPPPLVLPAPSYDLAALRCFSVLGIRPSLNLFIAWHLVAIAPFVFRTTLASLTQLDAPLPEASSNLGSSRFYSFRRITLPLIAPGIAAGAFLASMDNAPVSLFLSTAHTSMLPIRMRGMMEATLDVRIAPIAGALIVAILVLMVVMDRFAGLTRRMSA